MSSSADTAIYHRADIYHDFYRGRGKDYAAEAMFLQELIRERNPGAAALLDAACGTGAHLREFGDAFHDRTGVDISAEMLAVAERHAPGTVLRQGDLREVRLGRRFDAITCLFSSIGYLADTGELDQAVENLSAHLAPNGVLVIEPWWSPANFRPGWVGADVVTVEGRTIARVSHTVREGASSRMEVHYTVAAREQGIEHFTDSHLMSLFDHDTYLAAFDKAGLRAQHVGHQDRTPGFLVAVREEGTE